jgi:hypothetical protein
MLDYANVKDYGAKGDGTTNDTTAVNNAINNARNAYFPSGTYLCNVNVTDNFFNISGEGPALTILRPWNPTTPVLQLNSVYGNCNGWTLENLTVDGTNRTGTAKYSQGVLFEGRPPTPQYKAFSNGLMNNVQINNTTTALQLYADYNLTNYNFLYANTFSNIRMVGNTTGMMVDDGACYQLYQNIRIEMGTGDSGYAIMAGGQKDLWEQIYVQGPILAGWSYGSRYNVWNKITIDGIGATSPPTTYAFNDNAVYQHIMDLTLKSIPSAKCPIGFYGGGTNCLVNKISSEGADPGTPVAIAGGSSGIFVDVDTISKSVTTFNSGADFANWQIAPGGSYFAALHKKQMFGTAAPTTGAYNQGDRMFNTNPSPNGNNMGWVCTTGGSPGTWKSFGSVSA